MMSDIVTAGVDLLDKALDFVPRDILQQAPRSRDISNEAAKVINELCQVPGITPASPMDLKNSVNLFKLADGTIVSQFKSFGRFEHVFLSNTEGECIFGGYVGWVHNQGLLNKIRELQQRYAK
jgi:hypothetical protein